VAEPLDGVLRDARTLYRAHAGRMLLLAAAVFLPAGCIDVLITMNQGSGAWCDIADELAALVLIAIVAANPPPDAAGRPAPPKAQTTSVVPTALRFLTGGTIFACVLAATTSSVSVLGHLEFLVALPCFYLAFMWLLVVPVIVIEGTGPVAALRRSWQLIHGHGPRLFLELVKAYFGVLLVMLIPLLLATPPVEPYPLGLRMVPVAGGILCGPFAALALTLTYYRLAAAHATTELGALPRSSG
jgi:hypothetical protein